MKNPIRPVALVFVFLTVLVRCGPTPTPKPLEVMKQWDFEDETTQGWGILVNDNVEESIDIVVSPDMAQGKFSLKITHVDEPTEESNARKKLVAVHVLTNELSKARYMKADVYLPAEVAKRVEYADAKLFLKAGNFVWYDSGGGGGGVLINHFGNQWVSVEWSLQEVPPERKDYIGVQIYMKDNFDGPVYIDNVILYE